MARVNEQDRRFKRTERALKDAVVGLILAKGYEAVTIRDITDRADIAYATFFRHYKSKDELLLKYLEESIRNLEHQAHENDSERSYFQREGELVFRYAQQNAELFKAVFESRRIVRHLTERLAAHVLRLAKPRLELLPFPPEITANHIAASALALLDWWLLHDMPYPAEKMAQVYETLIVEKTLAQTTPGTS